MALFHWQQRFLIGIAEIDEHHIHLVGLLNTAYDDFIRSAAMERLNALFLDLIDYATYHFAAEERLMAGASYPGADEHGRNHRDFAARVTEMHRDFLAGKPVYLEILTFLKGWLEAHILKADSDLGKFLKTTGK
jgi:hemerythrin